MNNLKIIVRLNITALNIRAYEERLVCWVSDYLARVENVSTFCFSFCERLDWSVGYISYL